MQIRMSCDLEIVEIRIKQKAKPRIPEITRVRFSLGMIQLNKEWLHQR